MQLPIIWALTSGAATSGNEIQEFSDAIVSMVPPIIANNYAIVLGILLCYVALHLLKKCVVLVIVIAVAAVAVTVLTNLGVMPDLNQVFGTISNFMNASRQLPL